MIPPALAEIVLAKRNPLFLFRLSGWFLLRFAERRFLGLLFQEPPRRTRRQGVDQAPGRAKTRGPETEDERSSATIMRRVAFLAPEPSWPVPKKNRLAFGEILGLRCVTSDVPKDVKMLRGKI